MINILYFASLREQLGVANEALEITSGTQDMADLTAQLQGRGGVWAETFGADETVLMSVNQQIANASTPIKDGDEIAYFPPVTGG